MSKDKHYILFHCNCGCDFRIIEPIFIKMLLVYKAYCPVCHAICKRAIEEVCYDENDEND